MAKAKKPTWYYIGAYFFLFGVFVNILSKDGNKLAILLWAPLSILMFVLAYKKGKKYKEENEIALAHAANDLRVFIKIKDFYKTVVEGKENNIDQVVSEIINSENLTESQVNEIADKAVKSVIDDIVIMAHEKDSLSPEDYEKILTIARKLNVNLKFDAKTENTLSKLKNYWKIENGELTILDTSIALPKGEVCYYYNSCRWLEHKTVTKGIAYKGLTGSFKIAKGLRYRVGQLQLQRIKVDTLLEIDKGNVFLTNKRIIFMGAKKNSNIKYAAVLSITPYSDGVGIEKDSGKSPILMCNDSDIMARILTRQINE